MQKLKKLLVPDKKMSDFIGVFTNNAYICIGKNYLIP